MRYSIEERLLSRRVIDPVTGCWIFDGPLTAKGYARMRRSVDQGGGMAHVHVLAHELWKGPVPPGKMVCHECDNRPCFNPDHLFAGTNQDNMDDMVSKGRQGKKGCPRKLTAEIAEQIRSRRANGELQRVLACEYGVTETMIRMIEKGRSWLS
jgi:hypothetical protein